MAIEPLLGRPGIGSARTAQYGSVFRDVDAAYGFFSHGGVIDGASRDFGNSDNLRLLRPGTLMGMVTASRKWKPTLIGVTGGAYSSGTTLTLTAASAAELVRRVGAAGTFQLTGPASAGGAVRTTTVTYSAADAGTGAVTITALGANQAEDVRINPAATGGNIQLNVSKPDGTRVTTANAAWSATDATYLAGINSALDTATGVAGGVVATAISATDTDLGFTLTYSGAGYAGLSWPQAAVAVLPTSATGWYVVPRTTASAGPFVTAALVTAADGSEVPRSVIPDGYGVLIPSDSSDVDFPHLPTRATLQVDKIQGWPADAGLRQYLKDALDANGRGKWVFSDEFSYG